jgi:hypothetical protein
MPKPARKGRRVRVVPLRGGHWVTLHPAGEEERTGRPYRRVYIRDGRIVAGPRRLRGKTFAQAMEDARLRIRSHADAVRYYERQLVLLDAAARRLARTLRAEAGDHGTLAGLRRQIADVTSGKMIRPGGRYAGEIREDVPRSWVRRDGLPLDEVADMLGTDASELLVDIMRARSRGRPTAADWLRQAKREMEHEYDAVESELRRARRALAHERMSAARMLRQRRRGA